MEIISGGQGNVGPSDQTTPRTPHTTPISSTEQSTTRSATPSRAAEGAADVAPPTTDVAEEGVDAGIDRDVEAFPGSSRVTSTGSIKCTLEEISTQNGPFNFYSNSMSSYVSQ